MKFIINEILSNLYKSDKSWNIARLRYFNPVGSHESGLFGDDYDTKDGTGVRDYIHVVDLALGHLKALGKLKTNPGLVTYNLGTGIGYSVLDMIHAFVKASNKNIPFQISPRRQGDIAQCYALTDLAERELNWKAVRNVDDMCRDTWRWQTNNPNGYL